MARTSHIKDAWREQRLFLGRLFFMVVVVIAMTALIIGRLVQLQVLKYDYYSAQSSGNQIRVSPVPPIRGLILDRNGKLLAENTPSYQLEMTRERVPDVDETLARLASQGILDSEAVEETRELIYSRRSFDPVVIAQRLSDEALATFAVQRPHFPGIEIRARLGRSYLYGDAIAHALGYVGGISAEDKGRLDAAAYAGTTHVGKISIERAYESALHGEAGHENIVVNAHGRRMRVLGREPPRSGQDIILSLDLEAQMVADRLLATRRGAVVAIEPASGGVLVLASRPSYDPNAISAGLSRRAYAALQENPDRPLFNRALRGQYPPGSTIKPMVALAGLHYGVTTPEKRVGCRGVYMLPGSSHRYRDWRPEGHGPMDLQSSIEQSCDVYFYTLARDLGIDRMGDFLKTFGLGSLTGIDVGGEQPGLVPSVAWKKKAFRQPANQVWFPGETVIAGIGQGYMLATPLQLAEATATIANRGQRFQPSLLRGTRDPSTGRIEYRAPTPLPPVPETDAGRWDQVIEGMHRVMQGARGTARAAGANAPYAIAGKSGTAQVFTVAQSARYNAAELAEHLKDHALFIAFAPIDVPLIAVAVLIENGESGSKAAAPVARAVIDAYLRSKP
jgi:penicillin-binding protein 2